MRASKLIGDLRRGSLCIPSEHEYFDGYEQRLTRWRCEECKFFEKKVLSGGVMSFDELDAYIVCWFTGKMVDLVGRVTVCPKGCRPPLHKNAGKSDRSRLYCI